MTIIRFKLRTLNRIAHVFCCAVVLEVDEAGDEPTRISIEWKGLPWSNLRKRLAPLLHGRADQEIVAVGVVEGEATDGR